MKSCVFSLLLACVYLMVTLLGGSLHSHDDHDGGQVQDCAACALHFQGTSDEPPPSRITFHRAESDVQFPFQISVAFSVEVSLPPSRGPPVFA